MKLGVSMYSYVTEVQAGRMDIVSFIHEAKRIGADGVELLDFFYKDVESDRAAAMSALAKTGLPVGVFSVAQNFAKPTSEEREVHLKKILFGVDEAVKYGAKVVRVFAGDVPADASFGFEEARGWIIDGLVAGADYAQSKGIRLALENHGKLAGRGDQVAGIIADVRARCGHDALGANPDTGNFQLVGQQSHDAIREVASLAYMVHFKDFAQGEGEGRVYRSLDGTPFIGTVIGEGDVDLDACVQALRSAGFDGWVNLEYEGDLPDCKKAVEASLNNARRYLDSVGIA